MKIIFADTGYWIAIFSRGDAWTYAAIHGRRSVGQAKLVTTDEVLVEFLAAFGSAGPQARGQASDAVRRLLASPNVLVIPQTRQSFLEGLALYEARPDKGYSLTDCISMSVMRNLGITDALTNDRHFSQEGFTVLMKPAVS